MPERFTTMIFSSLLVLFLQAPLIYMHLGGTKCTLQCSNAFEVPAANCTSCDCKKGYYRPLKLAFLRAACEHCLTKCAKPMVLVGTCSGNVNSHCEACPEGQYYTMSGCMNCTKDCPHGVMVNCTVDEDTKCAKYSPIINATRIIYLSKIDQIEIKWLCMVGVICFIVGICFYAVIIRVIRRCCRSRTDKSDLATESSSNLQLQTGTPYQRKHFELTEQELSIPIRDLFGCCIDELAFLLNPNNGWKRLAGLLQYTPNDMAGFEHNGRFTQDLLSHWGTSGWATVGALLEALTTMGREDAYGVLASFIINQRPPQGVDEGSGIITPLYGVSDGSGSLADSASDASCMTQLIRSGDSVSGMHSESSI